MSLRNNLRELSANQQVSNNLSLKKFISCYFDLFLFRVLTDLSILERLSVGMIHSLLLSQIQSHVQDSCVGNFASSQIEILEKVLILLDRQ